MIGSSPTHLVPAASNPTKKTGLDLYWQWHDSLTPDQRHAYDVADWDLANLVHLAHIQHVEGLRIGSTAVKRAYNQREAIAYTLGRP